MQPKTIFAIYGSSNVGKSTTIKRIFDLLKANYPTAAVNEMNVGADITVIMEINGKFVGIESQGDPGGRLPVSLKIFQKAKCEIIICATRNWGATVEVVESLKPEFVIIWHHKKAEPVVKLQHRRNMIMARIIFNAAKKLL